MTQVPDFATKPTLTGERAILRPFVDADTPALLAALGDPDVRILTGSVHDEAAARKPASPEEEKLPPSGTPPATTPTTGSTWRSSTRRAAPASARRC